MGSQGPVAYTALFHQTSDGSESWYLVIKEDDSYWVEHTTPAGSTRVNAGVFISVQAPDSPLLKLLRRAISASITPRNG